MTTAKSQNVAYFLIFIGFLDTTAVCVTIMQLVPQIITLGASPILAGLIAALYGGVQFFSSTFVGNLGDTSDKKRLLLVSLVVSAASYFLLGYKSLVTFSIARVILGGFKHTHLLAQSYLTDIVPSSKKGDYFGYFGAGIGLGFIVGPTIAGHLGEWEDGYGAMTTFTAAGFLVNAVLVLVFLPKCPSKKNVPDLMTSSGKSKKEEINKLNKKSPAKNNSKHSISEMGVGKMWDVLLLELFSELSILVYFTNFMSIMTNKYALAPKSLGYMLSVISVVGMVMALLAGKLNRLAGKLLLPVGMTVVFGAFLALSFLPPYWLLVVALFFNFGAVALLRSVWPSILTARCSADAAGSAVGMSNSVMAISSMLGPVLAGVATEVTGDENGAVVLASAVSGLGALATVWLPKSKVTSKAKTS